MTDNDEPKAGTYLAQAQADAALEGGGRWSFGQKARFVGTEPFVTVPGPLPLWKQGPRPPDHDPLGYEIDEVLDMTTVSGLPRETEPVGEEVAEPIIEPDPDFAPAPTSDAAMGELLKAAFKRRF